MKWLRFLCLGIFCLFAMSSFATAAPWDKGNLEVSSNRHYLQHADGTPFLWVADTAWALTMRLDLDEAEIYLSDREARGYSVIQVASVGLGHGMLDTAYQIGCNEKPFVGDDPTAPNETYWTHVDDIITLAKNHNLYVALTVPWKELVLENGRSPKIITTLNAGAYATWLANRYKDVPNIVWVVGGDCPGNQAGDTFEIMDTVGSTIDSIDSNHLITYHGCDKSNPICLSSSCLFHNKSWLDFNMSYPCWDEHYMAYMYDYNLSSPSTKPSVCGEAVFSGWSNIQTRRQFYWLFLCGGCGYSQGYESMWDLWQDSDLTHVYNVTSGTNWDTILDDQEGALELLHAAAFFSSIDWWKLIPDNAGIIVSGESSGEWIKTAARSVDGNLVLVYFPENNPAVIDLSKITAGDTVTAKWRNTENASETSDGSYPATGTQMFTPPASWDDGLLILEGAVVEIYPPANVCINTR